MTWQPIKTAPKNATEILVLLEHKGDRHVMVAHWAEDLGGEEQPPFRGWFFWNVWQFSALPSEPTHWTPIPTFIFSGEPPKPKLAPGESKS